VYPELSALSTHAGDLFISLGGVPGKRGEHDCGLLQFVLGDHATSFFSHTFSDRVLPLSCSLHVYVMQSAFLYTARWLSHQTKADHGDIRSV
jgi:hypothetical protein